MIIVNKELKSIESQSHRTENWMGEGWASVPAEMEDKLMSLYPYIILTVADGAVTAIDDDITARQNAPKLEQPPTPDEDRDAMLADLSYRMTIIELGVI